jgi:hypothetical protein
LQRCSIEIGQTDLNEMEIEELVQSIGSKYTGSDYHLVFKNCNHFSDYLCQVRKETNGPTQESLLHNLKYLSRSCADRIYLHG